MIAIYMEFLLSDTVLSGFYLLIIRKGFILNSSEKLICMSASYLSNRLRYLLSDTQTSFGEYFKPLGDLIF